MEVEGAENSYDKEGAAAVTPPPPISKALKRSLIALNCVLMALGVSVFPLLLRLYFSGGGKRQWLSSWLQTGGWPLILLPLLISYLHRRGRQPRHRAPKIFHLTWRLFLCCAALGLLTGLDDFLYAYGLAFLPVSTSRLLVSTQLAFTALFAFLIVRLRFTPYSVNSVALLTAGAVMLGLHVGSDRPDGVTPGEYFKGFVLTLGAAALYGLILPLVELMYVKAEQAITYTLVMEMQLVMSFFATAFCTVGMLFNDDFQAIPSEAKSYKLGEFKYYMVLGWTMISCQFIFLGTFGVIFYVNTLLVGIIVAVFIPVIEVLGVIFLKEKFSSEKAMALVLSLWGLASYSYGEYREGRKEKEKTPTLINQST